MQKRLKVIFISQIILFFLVILLLFTALQDIIPLSAGIFFLLFSTLGLLFTLLVKRNIKKGKLKTLLLINGLSAFGFMLFAILHNLLYAVAEMMSVSTLNVFLDILSGIFFVLNVILSPVVFLVSAILAIIYYRKSKVEKHY